jgi:hypothetical protein
MKRTRKGKNTNIYLCSAFHKHTVPWLADWLGFLFTPGNVRDDPRISVTITHNTKAHVWQLNIS